MKEIKENPNERSLKARAESSGADVTADQWGWASNTLTEVGNQPLQERRARLGFLTGAGKQSRMDRPLIEEEMET